MRLVLLLSFQRGDLRGIPELQSEGRGSSISRVLVWGASMHQHLALETSSNLVPLHLREFLVSICFEVTPGCAQGSVLRDLS